MSDMTERFIRAAQNNGGVLGRDAIRSLMAEAWSEGFKQGGPMHDEHYGAPDKHKINPYDQAPDVAPAA